MSRPFEFGDVLRIIPSAFDVIKEIRESTRVIFLRPTLIGYYVIGLIEAAPNPLLRWERGVVYSGNGPWELDPEWPGQEGE